MKKQILLLSLSFLFIFIMYLLSWRDITVLIIYSSWVILYLFSFIPDINYVLEKYKLKILKNIILIIIFLVFISSIDYYSIPKPIIINDEYDNEYKPEMKNSNSDFFTLPPGKYERERIVVNGKVIKTIYRKIN